MISWGSFLLGGIVFGILFFFIGGVLGIQGTKANSISSNLPLFSVSKDILKYMSKGEGIHYSASIMKSDSDDDDGFEESIDPIVSDQNWRNN